MQIPSNDWQKKKKIDFKNKYESSLTFHATKHAQKFEACKKSPNEWSKLKDGLLDSLQT